MTRLFDDICLRAFPDLAGVQRLAAGLHARPMTQAETATYLHADPGIGWYATMPTATYAITIEQPPYRACAVRRMTSSGFPTVKPYLDSIAAYAAAHGGAHAVLALQNHARTAEGADISVYCHDVVSPAGAPSPEAMMLFLTNYHGRAQGVLAANVAPGAVGVEVRLVHQMAGRCS